MSLDQSVLADRLAKLLLREAPLPDPALPVERLAHALGALAGEPVRLGECTALLGDRLSGGLLYRTHKELVLERLERALAVLDVDGRTALLAAALELRPIDGEQLVRFARFALDALGLVAGRAAVARDGWTLAQRRVAYRWSSTLLSATALHTTELATQFAERGVVGQGGHPWDVFSAFTGTRATVVITPRQSAAVARDLRDMSREDWLDTPWMFGAARSTFTLDEVDEDSSPRNMEDGRRISHSLIHQRAPSTDFFAKTFAWHPRQSIAHVRAVAAERGFDLLEPAEIDAAPRVLERHELDDSARALQARALRALARLDATTLPLDVALSFVADDDGSARGVVELNVGASFKNDGAKVQVCATLGDPDALVATLRDHATLVAPATLPLLLARLYGCCARVDVACPDGSRGAVAGAQVALWDPAASRTAAPRTGRARARAPAPATVLGSWRGHGTPDHYPEPQPYTLSFDVDEHGALTAQAETPDLGPVELLGVATEGRVALRQRGDSRLYVVEAAWDEHARTITGRWRYGDMGGALSLAQQAPPREASAAELLQELTAPWSSHVRLDLEALRFPGERALLEALFSDEHFRTAYLEGQAARAAGSQAMQLESMVGRGASQLTRAMVPSVFRALEVAKGALGLRDEVRLWVQNDASLNAFVSVDDGAIAVHLTSGLIDTLSEVELQAAIGHELGHVLFGSHDLAIRLRGTRMSGDAQRCALALHRLQELSADRLSLIACADPHAVFQAQTMLRTGIKRRELLGGVEALFDAARAEVDRLRTLPKAHVAFDSHPYSSVRTVALELFAHSSAFRALRPDAAVPGRQLDDAAVAAQLAGLAELLAVPAAPAGPVPASASADAVPRFLALAALRLVEADQSIGVRELAALTQLHPRMADELQCVLAWSHERRDVEQLALRQAVNAALSVPEREQLLGALLTVVRADNVVQYAETSVVGDIGRLLELDTPSFRRLLDELYKSAR